MISQIFFLIIVTILNEINSWHLINRYEYVIKGLSFSPFIYVRSLQT